MIHWLMLIWRTVKVGFKSLWLHRLRSLLTALGIIFGVCSVIAMLAVGEGASFEAQEQIRQLGSNNIIVRSVKPSEEQKLNVQRSFVSDYGLTYLDLARLRDTIPGITVYAPGRIIRDRVFNATLSLESEILGVVPWYPEIRNLKLVEGRFFTPMEVEREVNVCVLNRPLARVLFPLTPPLGQLVRVGGDYYRVIGVADSAGSGKPVLSSERGNASTAGQMFIPLTTAKDRFGEILIRRSSGSFQAEKVQLHEITIHVDDQQRVEAVARLTGAVLERNRKKRDFEIIVPLELLRQAERTKQIFNTVLGAIAAISLLVGGIGIMNIMLASVTERTREIGIRRALGARRRDIVLQFLVETVILSGTGGLIGVGLGVLIPRLITLFSGMMTIVTPWGPMIAFSISALIGVVFGLYPALRAAYMDPVEALRHE
ncbi:MAG TPA: ABC transporter permease [Candidatus Hydrogenedentes bacterium]|nr:ABC transporter permease [Candidatus Hydrogenedentota bacterium]HOJ67373.1 ABC transporter permease [Candidatus Hydrogenedentota bacterium]HOK88767.1 ABC transporter permease [Candidatus Hydrogenedentota bacterium]